ncbi:putative serine/threonine-protein kinase DDB_G0280461 [Oratosquilla oratoria]|uniref:putative serine/threonine-protein kinase DDB_G0280461 n=1 Tax=Oratosquilla oratoria TaxID=337810 RepID=UPI003F76DF3E
MFVIGSDELIGLVKTSERLGEGAFAVAFRGLLKGRPVCTKAYKERASAQRNMQKEAGMLRLLDGLPGVPRLFYVCPAPLALVTSFDGHDILGAKLLEEPVPMTALDAVDVLTQVAETLKRLHARHLSHNDLKWDNIVLRQEGRRYIATIIDFGAACPIGMAPYRSCDERRHPHLAPEFAQGLVATFRSDVYSLGHVMECVLSRVSMTSWVQNALVALVAAARRPQPEERIPLGTLAARLSDISQVLSETRPQAFVRVIFAFVKELIGSGRALLVALRNRLWG